MEVSRDLTIVQRRVMMIMIMIMMMMMMIMMIMMSITAFFL